MLTFKSLIVELFDDERKIKNGKVSSHDSEPVHLKKEKSIAVLPSIKYMENYSQFLC